MKSARNALLLAMIASLGVMGIGANLQPTMAMPAPAALLAQDPGYSQSQMTIDAQSDGANLASVYVRKRTFNGVAKSWYVGKTEDGKYVLLTIIDTSDTGLIGLTPDGEWVMFH
jgi:hypothetical protein